MNTIEKLLLYVIIYFAGIILAAIFGAIVDAQDGNTAKDESIYISFGSYLVAAILLVVIIARLLRFLSLRVYKYVNKKMLCSH